MHCRVQLRPHIYDNDTKFKQTASAVTLLGQHKFTVSVDMEIVSCGGDSFSDGSNNRRIPTFKML